MAETTTQNTALHISNLVFSYGESDRTHRQFVCDDWSLNRGDQVFLHGKSGSGKSTLLNLLSGVLVPEKGRIRLLDIEVSSLSLAKRDAFRAKHLGIVFQQFNLIPYLSVLDNVALAAYFAKSKTNVAEQMKSMLISLQLQGLDVEKPVNTLSVGQQQRVAIMRAFINTPEILLIDEPTSSLDVAARDGFMNMLLEMSAKHKATLIFVSHDDALRSHFELHMPLSDICRWHSREETV